MKAIVYIYFLFNFSFLYRELTEFLNFALPFFHYLINFLNFLLYLDIMFIKVLITYALTSVVPKLLVKGSNVTFYLVFRFLKKVTDILGKDYLLKNIIIIIIIIIKLLYYYKAIIIII